MPQRHHQRTASGNGVTPSNSQPSASSLTRQLKHSATSTRRRYSAAFPKIESKFSADSKIESDFKSDLESSKDASVVGLIHFRLMNWLTSFCAPYFRLWMSKSCDLSSPIGRLIFDYPRNSCPGDSSKGRSREMPWVRFAWLRLGRLIDGCKFYSTQCYTF